MMTRKILITHTDLDGAGCAILFKLYHPNIEIEYHDYKTIDEVAARLWIDKDDYDMIYFTDISPSEEIGSAMLTNPKFAIIDHHVTREYLKGSPWFDIDHCGTYISNLYLNSLLFLSCDDPIMDFIYSVDAYDMWRLDSPYREDGLELNLLFGYYGMKEFVHEFSDMRRLDNTERTIITVLQKLERDFMEKKLTQGQIKEDEYGNVYFSVFIDQMRGNLGSIIEHPDFPSECQYIKCIFMNDNKVSLYSNKIDVSEIAKIRGGGGHKSAAGYEVT